MIPQALQDDLAKLKSATFFNSPPVCADRKKLRAIDGALLIRCIRRNV